MKRLIIPVYASAMGKPITVEAMCEKCVFHLDRTGMDLKRDLCYRNPKQVPVDKSDWCGEFKPDISKVDTDVSG